MNPTQHYEKLRRMYTSARINKNVFFGTSMQLEQGKCILTFNLSENFHHALGAAHGSVYFKMLDDAAFFAAQTGVTDAFIVTTSFNIHLVRPVSEGVLTATGTIRQQTRQFIIAEAVLHNEKSRELAFGTGTFMRSKALLTETPGYSD